MAIDLRTNLDAELERNRQLEEQVKGQEQQEAYFLTSKAEALEECKDTVVDCLYLVWKHNRDADFSFFHPDMLGQKREEFLQCLAKEKEEEVGEEATCLLTDASVKDSLALHDPQDISQGSQDVPATQDPKKKKK